MSTGQTISRNALCHCGSGKKYKRCCGNIVNPGHSVQSGFQALPEKSSLLKRDEDALIVAMPTRGTISVETHIALSDHLDGLKCMHVIIAHKPVVEARNELAACIKKVAKEKPFGFVPRETYVLWVDDDAWWPQGTVARAIDVLQKMPSLDLLAGSFSTRREYSNSIAFRDAGNGESYPKPGVDCRYGDVVEIARCGFHWVIHRATLLDRVGDDPFSLPEGSSANVSEDFAFCDRVRGAGGSIAVATSLPIAHIDTRDGAAYLPGMPASKIRNNQLARLTLQHQMQDGTLKFPEQHDYGIPELERVQAEAVANDPRSLDMVGGQT